MKRYLAVILLGLAPLASAQGLKSAVLDRLKAKSSNATVVDLPKDLIDFGRTVLNNADKDADRIKKLAEGLESVLVQSLEFDKEGVYKDDDVKQLIAEMSGANWKLIVSADEKNEKSRIWIKSSGNGELGGLRVLSAEGKELSVIEIIGKIRLSDLKDLEFLGLPHLNMGSEHSRPTVKKNEEE
jgi:hypothetical protein